VSDRRPLLVFRPPTIGPIPTGPPQGGQRQPAGPGAAAQGRRLTPRVQQLSAALQARRVGPDDREVDPQLIVVFDVAGAVADFARAVEKVPGLEFLAELADEEVEPDEDFFLVDEHGRRRTKLIPTSLYATFTDAEAARELIRMFHSWSTTDTLPHGYAPLRDAFRQCRDLRAWGPEDRVRETGLLADWEETVAVVGATNSARVEIELWFRGAAAARAAAQEEVGRAVTACGGAVIKSSVMEGIGYHAMLADIPYLEVTRILRDGPAAMDLLLTPSVMLVAAAHQVGPPTTSGAVRADAVARSLPIESTARVALLDGMPLTNHVLLSGRLLVDDPDGCEDSYQSGQRQHGTQMASLICHGDRSVDAAPLTSPLYVRPILSIDAVSGRELTSAGELLVDVLLRAFRRMFEGEGGEQAQAPGVRIVNLSIGDDRRPFVRRMSAPARLLDWLALTYNVLIVVSAGNHLGDLELGPALNPDSSDDDVTKAARARQLQDARLRSVLSPAEAVNALTVGALHADAATGPLPAHVVDVLPEGDPAGYSPGGGGFRRAVKPEILVPGGRQVYLRQVPGDTAIRPAQQTAVGPGLLTAAPDSGGGTTGLAFLVGTSGAAALTSRLAHDVLLTLEQEAGDVDPLYHPVLVRALLVHASSWSGPGEALRSALALDRPAFSRYYGYGRLEPDRALGGLPTRATVIGGGVIGDRQRHAWQLPLPTALASSRDWRRVTVTLAWLSAVNPRDVRYRKARLSVSPAAAPLATKRTQVDAQTTGRGTVQHEVYEGAKAVGFVEGDHLSMHVDCHIDAGTIPAGVRYGLAVSVEVATSLQVDLHEQVRLGLREPIRVRPRA
jgi:hypothetical protein